MTDKLNLDAIHARWVGVSPWPWQHEIDGERGGVLVAALSAIDYDHTGGPWHSVTSPHARDRDDIHVIRDAEAIAHAPYDISVLLAEVAHLRAVAMKHKDRSESNERITANLTNAMRAAVAALTLHGDAQHAQDILVDTLNQEKKHDP